MVNETPFKVLIIGAGPGGLALAQMLRKQHIEFEIFERDSVHNPRNQGLAVVLNGNSTIPLKEMIPNDLGDLNEIGVNFESGHLDTVAVYDGLTGEKVSERGDKPAGEVGHIVRVGRHLLGTYLKKGIAVTGGKHFSHYIEDGEGVTVYFRDGSQARGSMLVGVDGSNSLVRSQLLQQHRQVAPYVPIIGECQLTQEQYKPIFDLATAAWIAVLPGIRFFVGLQRIDPVTKVANYYWVVNFKSDNPEEEAERIAALSKEELYEKATELTKDMSDQFKRIIAISRAEGMRIPTLKYSEYVPPMSMPESRVTLLGDAAHSMMPFKGGGANTAFLDAINLTRVIMEATTQTMSMNEEVVVHSILQEYASKMLPRGRQMVLMSRAAGESMEHQRG